MPKAYWIAHVEVTDAETYGKYAAIATEAIAAHGGEFLARSGRYKQLEGNDRARNVVAGGIRSRRRLPDDADRSLPVDPWPVRQAKWFSFAAESS